MMRLDAATPPSRAYRPEALGVGIVHLGLGAFARAHLADYTDAALAAHGGDWRILGVSLRSADPAARISEQDGRFTLIERSTDGPQARVIGSIAAALCAVNDGAAVLAAMAAPGCRIVSITVTEKGYGLDRIRGGCDPAHPAVAADLATPLHPVGVLGLVVRALAMRFQTGVPAFAVLSCDNLPDNGRLLRGAVVDFARRIDPALASRIGAEVAFPATMVDRITPAPMDQTRADAAQLTGHEDAAAVETEPFSQWVIEESFPLGRPSWEVGGALLVTDVRPYEAMKLRMLNGAHSMMAYAGFHAGLPLVRDVMRDLALARLVARHLSAAADTLFPVPAVDLPAYAEALQTRFANPAMAHATFQIAMDGTEKLPQRVFAPALDAARNGRDLRPFAFATAAWMRHATRATTDCPPYPLRDPRAEEIAARLADTHDAASVVERLCNLTSFMPPALIGLTSWRNSLTELLTGMLRDGMRATLDSEAEL